uniref:Wnt ligand secretion mediator n=1 Tax=Callorhinchus milii TaxID=7868 RepID=A0A4W3GEG0_CALMI
MLFEITFWCKRHCITPSPTTGIPYLATKCVDVRKNQVGSKWFMPWGPSQCEKKIQDFSEAKDQDIGTNDIVFAIHIPHPNWQMSPWFQFLLVILQFDIIYTAQNPIRQGAMVTLDVSLGYRDDQVSEWTEIAHSMEKRKLTCNFTSLKVTLIDDGRQYDCELLPFMELGSVTHKYYLINMRLPVNEDKFINLQIGQLKDIRFAIHQNGGFTKVWFAMKTFLTPSILIILVWYWRRITMIIFVLGISMTFINIPVEWFSIGFNWTWMLLFGDIRQGIFYSILLSFWIIFCGEHLMVGVNFHYSGESIALGPHLAGVQLKNPFYSIWATDVGTELAMAFIIVAGICACLYFLFLCFMVFQVFRNISGKRCSLPAMSKVRRLHYQGLIFRFKFLMLVTLTCAAMTVTFFIISQVNEGHWKWGDFTVQVNSAFFTGIYGMWNLYVFAIMFLYAPSHKCYSDAGQSNGASGEELQLTTTITHADGPTEIYRLAGKEAQE